MKKVLIVEDDFASLALIKIILKSYPEKLHIFEAKNGEEAIRILNYEQNINLMLLDILMPIMDGREVLKNIKSQTKFNNLSIIAITTDCSSKTNLFELGIDDFITKPIKKEEFLEKIKDRL